MRVAGLENNQKPKSSSNTSSFSNISFLFFRLHLPLGTSFHTHKNKFLLPHSHASSHRIMYVVQYEERRMMRFVRMRQIRDESGDNAANGNDFGMKK